MGFMTKTMGTATIALSIMAGVAATKSPKADVDSIEPQRKEVKWDNSKSYVDNTINTAKAVGYNAKQATIEAADKATEPENTVPLATAAALAGLGFVGAKRIEKKQQAKTQMEAIAKAEQAKVETLAKLEELDKKYIDLSVKQGKQLAGKLFDLQGKIQQEKSLLNGGYKKKINDLEKKIEDNKLHIRILNDDIYYGRTKSSGYSPDGDHVYGAYDHTSAAYRKIDDAEQNIRDCKDKINDIDKQWGSAPRRIAALKDEYRAIVKEIKDIDVERANISKEYNEIIKANPHLKFSSKNSKLYSIGLCYERVNNIALHENFNMKYIASKLEENPDNL